VLLAMGLVFQVPVAILAATRMGIVSPRTLRRNRRYAIVACAVVAAFLPGDVITLVLETVPLYLLYELSILVASFVGRPRDTSDDRTGAPAWQPAPAKDADAEPSVQRIIDHTDRDLAG
jgi:Sec-independent protein secretion pathway component TatC